MRILYYLYVEAPDEIDAATAEEILEEADVTDTTELARTQRFLGSYVSDRVTDLSADLPEGWRAFVIDAPDTVQEGVNG